MSWKVYFEYLILLRDKQDKVKKMCLYNVYFLT